MVEAFDFMRFRSSPVATPFLVSGTDGLDADRTDRKAEVETESSSHRQLRCCLLVGVYHSGIQRLVSIWQIIKKNLYLCAGLVSSVVLSYVETGFCKDPTLPCFFTE